MHSTPSEIIFPTRISKIIEIKKSSFGKEIMYSAEISLENGDNFKYFSPKLQLFSKLNVNVCISYNLVNTHEKSRIKNLKIMETQPLLSNLNGIDIHSILFIDIEIVSSLPNLTKGTPTYDAWAYKQRKEDSDLIISYSTDAPLYAEFGKIVTISIGMVKTDGEVYMKSYYSHDEKELLTDFVKNLQAFVKNIPNLKICGHSIIGFDIPYIIRRLLVNGIKVPDFINFINEKPWTLENKCIDLHQLWKSTGFYGSSLVAMALAFDIPSPKNNMDGSEVSSIYHKSDKNLTKIVKYCEQDVFCVIQIFQKLMNKGLNTSFISKTFEK